MKYIWIKVGCILALSCSQEPIQEKKPEPKDEDKEKEEEPKNAEEKTFKKRYGDLRRHSQQKEKELQVKIEELSKQLSEATKKDI